MKPRSFSRSAQLSLVAVAILAGRAQAQTAPVCQGETTGSVGYPMNVRCNVSANSATTLPAGLRSSFGEITAIVSGTPTQAGTFTVNLTRLSVTGGPAITVASITLTINDALSLPSTQFEGVAGAIHNEGLKAAGGVGPYTWRLEDTSSIFTITSAGVLSLAAQPAGTYSIRVRVTDSSRCTLCSVASALPPQFKIETIQITLRSPAPTITSAIDAATQLANAPICGPQFVLRVNGTNFASGAQVVWNGTALAAALGTAQTSTVLQAIVPANLLMATITPSITVRNPAVGTQPQTTSSPYTGFAATVGRPILVSVTPAETTVNTPATLSVTGSGFIQSGSGLASVLVWTAPNSPGIELPMDPASANFNGCTQFRVAVPAARLTAPGTVTLSVRNFPTSATSLNSAESRTFTIRPLATPAISNLSPTSVLAGSPSFPLTITGTNLGNIVYWRVAGTQQQTQLIITSPPSATEVRVTVPAELIAQPRSIEILVQRVAEGGTTTSEPFPFEVRGLTPSIISAFDATTSLASAPVCGPQFVLQVNGTGFAAGAQVYWNSTLLNAAPSGTTTSTALQVIAPAVLLASPVIPTLTVRNPAAGSQPETPSQPYGGFVVSVGKPVLDAILPAETLINTPVTMTVSGSGFTRSGFGVPASVLLWTPQNSPTIELPMDPASSTFNGCTEFRVVVPAERLTVAGTVSVTVRNVLSTGATSTSAEVKIFTIRAVAVSAPTITQVDPPSALAGSGDTRITITGTNFTSATTISLGGQPLTVIAGSVTSTSLQVAAPRSMFAVAGNPALVATNSASSAPRAFPVLALPRIEAPSTARAGDQPEVSVTLPSAAAAEYRNVELTLNFVRASTVAGWGNSTNPQVVFTNGSATMTFTIAAGATANRLPIAVGTVAGTITATINRINGTSVSIPAGAITVAQELVIRPGSVRITGVSATGFTVELDGYSTTRALTNVVFTFQAAAGATLNGASAPVTVPLATAASSYFVDDSTSRARGGNFHLSVPFDYSGSPDALGTVSAVLALGAQSSLAVSGSR